MKTVRIYGFVRGYGSYAQVTRGFGEAFAAHELSSESLDLFGLEEEPSFDEEPEGLPQAEVAILTGPPIAAPRMTVGALHRERFVMVAPNSDRVPEKTMAVVNAHATGILVPSRWASSVLANYTEKQIIIVPHGISPGFRVYEEPRGEGGLEALYEAGAFRVLHLSSTERQRKGTLELCQAFLIALEENVIPPRSVLSLVLTPEARARMLDWLMDRAQSVRGQIVLRDRLNMDGASPEELAREVYARAHVVCQPSRGEGFGLVPLESLASGVPIVATRVTGHREWFCDARMPGTTVVETRAPEPIDDVPGATAPGLYVADIVNALGEAYRDWHERKAEALAHSEMIRAQWSWPRQLSAFIGWLNG